jgi:hypothetical protein
LDATLTVSQAHFAPRAPGSEAIIVILDNFYLNWELERVKYFVVDKYYYQ